MEKIKEKASFRQKEEIFMKKEEAMLKELHERRQTADTAPLKSKLSKMFTNIVDSSDKDIKQNQKQNPHPSNVRIKGQRQRSSVKVEKVKRHVHNLYMKKLLDILSQDINLRDYIENDGCNSKKITKQQEDFIKNYGNNVLTICLTKMNELVIKNIADVLCQFESTKKMEFLEKVISYLKEYLSGLLALKFKRYQPTDSDIQFLKKCAVLSISQTYQSMLPEGHELPHYLEELGRSSFRLEYQLTINKKLNALHTFNGKFSVLSQEMSAGKQTFISGDEYIPCLIHSLVNSHQGLMYSEIKT